MKVVANGVAAWKLLRCASVCLALCVSWVPALAFEREEHRAVANGALFLALADIARSRHADADAHAFIATACRYLPSGLAGALKKILDAMPRGTYATPAPPDTCVGAGSRDPTFGEISACVDHLTDPIQLLRWDAHDTSIASTCDNFLKELARATDNETHFQQSAVDSYTTRERAAFSLLRDMRDPDGALRQMAIAAHYLNDILAPGHLAARRIETSDPVALARHDSVNRRGARFRPSCRLLPAVEAILSLSSDLEPLRSKYSRQSRFIPRFIRYDWAKETVDALFRPTEDPVQVFMALKQQLEARGAEGEPALAESGILFRGDGMLRFGDGTELDSSLQRAVLLTVVKTALLRMYFGVEYNVPPNAKCAARERRLEWPAVLAVVRPREPTLHHASACAGCSLEILGIGRFDGLRYLSCPSTSPNGASEDADRQDARIWDARPEWFEFVPQVSFSTVTTTSKSEFNTYLLQFEPARFFVPALGDNAWLTLGWAVASRNAEMSWRGDGPQVRVNVGFPAIKTAFSVYARYLSFSPKADFDPASRSFSDENLAFRVRGIGIRTDYGFTDAVTLFVAAQHDEWYATTPLGTKRNGFWGESISIGISLAFPANRWLPILRP